jgi:glutamate synthase domain-containing protein 2
MSEFFEIIAGLPWWAYVIIILAIIAIRDIFFNRAHSIKHNFPIVGHFRYILEKIGPELRQYIVANNREERPFNRVQRGWVYASAKNMNNYEGFGTDQDIYTHQHIFIKPEMMPFKLENGHPNIEDPSFLPCAKKIGPHRKRPFRPYSVINISAMSFGSLSAKAVESLNKGAKKAGCYHNTGEGGLSPYHCYGSDVIFHIGTGYFGVRDNEGNFSMSKLEKIVENYPQVRAIEVKLSQGAKPGKGGVLPGAKITAEIAEIRGVEMGKDVISPPNHKEFSNIPELVDFLEAIAERTGLPVGIKSAVGKLEMWDELATVMYDTGRGPDFITIDGGEGGTGAAPPSFADHVSLPFIYAFNDVYKVFQKHEVAEKVVFIGSGKLGFPADAVMAFALGVDVINVAREAMMSIGCIQAQICHTNRCPSGVATQNKWLQNGIDTTLKSERFYNYQKALKKELLEITRSSGYEHPAQFDCSDVELAVTDHNLLTTLEQVFSFSKTPVHFKGMQDLKDCPNLGGHGPSK